MRFNPTITPAHLADAEASAYESTGAYWPKCCGIRMHYSGTGRGASLLTAFTCSKCGSTHKVTPLKMVAEGVCRGRWTFGEVLVKVNTGTPTS